MLNDLLRGLMKVGPAVSRRLVDGFGAELYLRAQGVEFGRNLTARGLPRVVRMGTGAITIGDDVILNSRPLSSPAWLERPCVFSVLTERASITIGSRSGLSGVAICCADRVTVGDDTLLGANVMIFDTDFHPIDPDERLRNRNGGVVKPVAIGNNVFVGANAIVLPGVEIGDGAVIGAGAIVMTSVPSRTLAMGNPARVVRKLG